jgi:diaminohydroxyphosphoribosylaminopyrimidine deaminase/5-amino-6-(5-phosphoribosylamino)uracil reductase
MGWLGDISDFLNAPYRSAVLKKRPLVTAKVAVSEDGKIGVRGKRIQLSGTECLRRTMHLRAQAGAILVGSKTILNDDPILTIRGKYADRKPIRAILDPDLETPPTAKIFSVNGGPVWIFTKPKQAKSPQAELLQKPGVRILPAIETLHDVLECLVSAGVNAVLVEGGAETLSSFARAGLIDRWVVYKTPHQLGTMCEGFPTVSFEINTDGFQRIRRGADWELVTDLFRLATPST